MKTNTEHTLIASHTVTVLKNANNWTRVLKLMERFLSFILSFYFSSRIINNKLWTPIHNMQQTQYFKVKMCNKLSWCRFILSNKFLIVLLYNFSGEISCQCVSFVSGSFGKCFYIQLEQNTKDYVVGFQSITGWYTCQHVLTYICMCY